MALDALRALLQFCTILPLGRPADFDAFARYTWLYPLAGYVIGGIAAGVAFLLGNHAAVAAVAAIATAIIVSGANHFDGLLDLGDGLMAHGSREKRVTALTDRQIGAGGVACGLLTTLIAVEGLSAAWSVPFVVLTAEVCAKLAMAWITTLGAPFHDGIHAYLHSFAKKRFVIYALLLVLPLFLLPLGPALIGRALLVTALVAVLLVCLATHLFGGVNGDVAGASNEITRAAVALALAL
ncbi:adenosylcobinamide-GDP ribazoletransferase [Methanofollis sp. W23]|uniref:adenosylcobinamide-GDP ribazoletransferase n=1 Tax=Methanofollis sp. W23 TaxID=2817849 RepID=UPI001AE67BCC|nr:adenosylcobinamide-GDP ribazoletransferase [Methanofollis sp. W23]MBP2144717.1 adenosylcobinamide-GDP ribazoletransferase [Methanofollis sp. W23]